MPTAHLDLAKPDAPLCAVDHALFSSLLGALAWLNQTRLDSCIFVCALQRIASKPTTAHIVRINAVCRWVRRKEAFLCFKSVPGPVRLIVVADSAFRREDLTGLAMRGHVIALASPPADIAHRALQGDGPPETVTVQILDWSARRQKRVVRSTFAAELHSMCDAIEHSKLITLAFTEVYQPGKSPVQLAEALELGRLFLRIDVYTDCRSIYDSLKTADLRIPTEAGLYPLLLIVQHLLRTLVIHRLYWRDTRDMLADGLNKGAVARNALLSTPKISKWVLTYASKWVRKLPT